MMSAGTIYRLGNVIKYHEQMAEANKPSDRPKLEDEEPTAADKTKDDLHKLHSEVAKQLQDLLAAEPGGIKILQEKAEQSIHRSQSIFRRDRTARGQARLIH